MEAVFQFDHGNGREHDLGFPVHLFKAGQQLTHRLGTTLGGNEHAGVED
jgi:hypothetical protein